MRYALVFELLVLIQQPLTLGLGVLRVPDPARPKRLAVERVGGERGAEIVHPDPRGLELDRGRLAGDPLLNRDQVPADLVELRDDAVARGLPLGLAVQERELGREARAAARVGA